MPTIVQKAVGGDNSGTANHTITITFSSGFLAGSTIVGSFGWSVNASESPASISDGVNNYSIIDNQFAGDSFGILITFSGAAAPGQTVITLTFNTGVNRSFTFGGAIEVQGVGPVDAHAINYQAATSAPSSGNITTSKGTSFIYGAQYLLAVTSGSITDITAGSGFTTQNHNATNLWCDESQIQANAGTVAATFTLTGGGSCDINTAIVAFLPAGPISPFEYRFVPRFTQTSLPTEAYLPQTPIIAKGILVPFQDFVPARVRGRQDPAIDGAGFESAMSWFVTGFALGAGPGSPLGVTTGIGLGVTGVVTLPSAISSYQESLPAVPRLKSTVVLPEPVIFPYRSLASGVASYQPFPDVPRFKTFFKVDEQTTPPRLLVVPSHIPFPDVPRFRPGVFFYDQISNTYWFPISFGVQDYQPFPDVPRWRPNMSFYDPGNNPPQNPVVPVLPAHFEQFSTWPRFRPQVLWYDQSSMPPQTKGGPVPRKGHRNIIYGVVHGEENNGIIQGILSWWGTTP